MNTTTATTKTESPPIPPLDISKVRCPKFAPSALYRMMPSPEIASPVCVRQHVMVDLDSYEDKTHYRETVRSPTSHGLRYVFGIGAVLIVVALLLACGSLGWSLLIRR